MQTKAEGRYEDYIGEKLPYGIMEKQPTLELKEYYLQHFNDYRETLSEQLESSMFFTYHYDHFADPHTGGPLWLGKADSEKRILTGAQLQQVFERGDFDPVWEKEGWTYASYAEHFPAPEEREATFAMIFTDGKRVVFGIDNTYKYQEWDELFDAMTNGETLCRRRGVQRAFVIYTDSSDRLPVWTLYEKTIAGFAVDNEKKTLTAFGPEDAVLIFHSLYQLCSAQYGCSFGVTGRTCTPHTHDDSPKASGADLYVRAFRARLDRYQEAFSRFALLKRLDGLENKANIPGPPRPETGRTERRDFCGETPFACIGE